MWRVLAGVRWAVGVPDSDIYDSTSSEVADLAVALAVVFSGQTSAYAGAMCLSVPLIHEGRRELKGGRAVRCLSLRTGYLSNLNRKTVRCRIQSHIKVWV